VSVAITVGTGLTNILCVQHGAEQGSLFLLCCTYLWLLGKEIRARTAITYYGSDYSGKQCGESTGKWPHQARSGITRMDYRFITRVLTLDQRLWFH